MSGAEIIHGMTPDRATALRKPFPPESVGQLPKPYKADSPKGNCNECGGYHGLPAVHLDYVGHAAVTDRLLTVDPWWSWEPMAFDQYGSPQMDRDNNLWIKLTVCGVTRLGVGDGKNMKERIGDAIRNASMRFGVGLDLWAKENLVEFAQAATAQPATPEPEPEPDLDASLRAALDAPMSEKARARMFALFADHHIDDPEQQRRGIAAIIGREITSRGELTEGECQAVIRDLAARPKP